MRGLRPLMPSPICVAAGVGGSLTTCCGNVCLHPPPDPLPLVAFAPVKLRCSGRGMINEGAAPPHALPHLRGSRGWRLSYGLLRQVLSAPTP